MYLSDYTVYFYTLMYSSYSFFHHSFLPSEPIYVISSISIWVSLQDKSVSDHLSRKKIIANICVLCLSDLESV